MITAWKSSAKIVLLSTLSAAPVLAAESPIVLTRDNSTIALEPYAPNIIRVTLSLQKDQVLSSPGFGFVGKPSGDSWSHQHTDAADVYKSSRMVVTVDANSA